MVFRDKVHGAGRGYCLRQGALLPVIADADSSSARLPERADMWRAHRHLESR
jgi:hypothetical protein